MKIDIEPEDKSVPEEFVTRQHPGIIKRLRAYADAKSSSVDYTLGKLLDMVLPSDKPAKQRRTKAAKEAIRKVA